MYTIARNVFHAHIPHLALPPSTVPTVWCGSPSFHHPPPRYMNLCNARAFLDCEGNTVRICVFRTTLPISDDYNRGVTLTRLGRNRYLQEISRFILADARDLSSTDCGEENLVFLAREPREYRKGGVRRRVPRDV